MAKSKDKDLICSEIARGKTLTAILKEYDCLPDANSTIYRWIQKDKKFAEDYKEARRIQMYQWIDDVMDLARQPFPPCESAIELNAFKEQRRMELDSLKFITGKLAGKMIPELADKQPELAQTDNKLVIVNYSVDKTKELIDKHRSTFDALHKINEEDKELLQTLGDKDNDQ